MTVSEHIVYYLSLHRIRQVFMVNGGGAMYLNDAFAKSDMNVTYCNHEQACAMAAVGYNKVHNEPVVVVTSTGCGSTNAMTGLLDAWQDGCKVLFLSGNVSLSDSDQVGIGKKRKHGVQGANIIELVTPITKYAAVVRSKNVDIYLNKAIIAIDEDTPGPVWLDIPMDIQKDEYVSANDTIYNSIEALKNASRPIIVAGNGIKQSNMIGGFRHLITKHKVPFVTTYLTIDLLESTHPLNIGRLGTKGDRAGNYAVRQADVVIVLGSSLTVPVIGYGSDFYRGTIYNINIEEGCKEFMDAFHRSSFEAKRDWIDECFGWKKKWPVYDPDINQSNEDGVDIYQLIHYVGVYSPDDAIIVSDAGSAYYAVSQSYQIKGTQKYVTSGGQADMGFSLPAAIGAALSSNQMVIAFTGDGSIHMNIQELATMHGLPIKLFVINNGGYLSIRNTNKKFFEGRSRGTDNSNGLYLPESLEKICEGYGIQYSMIDYEDLSESVNVVLQDMFPSVIEVYCKKDQEILPCAAQGYGLDKMYPFI